MPTRAFVHSIVYFTNILTLKETAMQSVKNRPSTVS